MTIVPRLQVREPTLPGAPPGTKGRILEVALRWFAERGFYGTSMRDLAADLGIQAAAVYNHYASKEHVLAELVRIGHEVHNGDLHNALLEVGNSPEEQLRGWVRAHVRFHAQHAMLAIVANNEMHVLSPDRVAPALALRKESEELLVRIIVRGADQGVFDPPDAWLAAAAIGGMGIRVATWFRPEFDAEHVAKVYAELAERMLARRRRKK